MRSHLLILTAAAVAAGACGSSTKTSTGPSPTKCQVSLSAPQGALDSGGGSATIIVATEAECAWNAASDVGWITGLSPASGQGAGEVRFQVAANSTPTLRLGRITLNGTAVQVSQAGQSACRVEISSRAEALDAAGGVGAVQVTAPDHCSWSGTSNEPWLTIPLGATGTGNGSLRFQVAPNSGPARIGTITIADQTMVVTQTGPGAPQCSYTIQPESVSVAAAGGPTVVAVQAAPSCSWTAASGVSWLAVAGVGLGSGSANVTINVASNTGGARSGTAVIAGRVFTVNQAAGSQAPACAPSLSPSSATLTAAGGQGPAIAVTIAAGCPWTASTATSWLTITQGTGGNGNGTVGFSATANTGSVRTGSLTIAGLTFPVTQPGSCATSINPQSQSLPATAGNGSAISVSAAGGCGWTATTSTPWITITGGAADSGNGNVTFSVTANSGGGRTGTISIGTQTHTVNQAGTCTTTIAPPSQSVAAAGGAATSITVTTSPGCGWDATPSQNWITITSGASGVGSGTVGLSVAANSGPARAATVTIAGQTHTVNQAAGACTATIAPPSQSVAAGGGAATSITVTTAAGCGWNATPSQGWITITSGASGVGPGTVAFSVAANTGIARSATITIAGQTHTVNQANGCTYTVTPGSHSLDSEAQTAPAITVTTGTGCTWTAVSNTGFITVETGASGTGPGTVTYRVTKHNGNNPRTGTLTIAGRTFTVVQDGK